MNDDLTLLREYTARNSEAAFAELVSRHVNLVHSVALRQVRDPHLAEEVTQAVFVILARKAHRLGDKTILPGWLCRTASYVAAEALRTERRRQRREQEACLQSLLKEPEPELWPRIAPLLEDAMARLNRQDHDALILRFYQNKTFAEVGQTLGASEDAAKMRVNRALEKLRRIFNKHGVTASALLIATVVSANAVQAAPVTLGTTISAVAATTKGAAAGATTLTLIKGALKIMAWTKAKMAIMVGLGVLLVAGTTPVVIGQLRAPAIRPAQTDLTPGEVKEAIGLLVRERHMWAQLTRLSAHIVVQGNSTENGKVLASVSLEGDLSMRRTLFPQGGKGDKYEMIISNATEGWRYTTDGTSEHSTLVCADPATRQRLDGYGMWGWAALFVLPEQLLTPFYKDSLTPTVGLLTFKQAMAQYAVVHNQEVPDAPQSYAFQKVVNAGAGGLVEFAFVRGHSAKFVFLGNGGVKVTETLGQFIESNHSWYPTQIGVETSNGKVTASMAIRLTNIAINHL